METISKKNKSILSLVIAGLIVVFGGTTSTIHFLGQSHTFQVLTRTNKVSDTPSKEKSQSIIESVKSQTHGNKFVYDNGSWIIDNNQNNLTAKNNMQQFASNTVDNLDRPQTATAFLTRNARQYKKREETNNGATNWVPLGYHQIKDLPGRYHYAYNRGHLLGYALVGNIQGFDASESNPKNIITQTSWANQANSPTSKGQNYYESLVRKALDRNKKVMYQVTPLYINNNPVASAVWIRAKSTDNTLNINVLVPNVQANLHINYVSGFCNKDV